MNEPRQTRKRIRVSEVQLGVFELRVDRQHVGYYESVELAHRTGVDFAQFNPLGCLARGGAGSCDYGSDGACLYCGDWKEN